MAKFNFTGTSLKIMGCRRSTSCTNVQISIDGIIENYSEYFNGYQFQTIVYSKTGLADKEHYVTIIPMVSGDVYIDIIYTDDGGILKPYLHTTVFHLIKTADNKCYGVI